MISKRRLFARTLERIGVLRGLEASRGKPGLLVINHHRIGDPEATRFDRGVFSATEAELDRQVRYLRQHYPVVWGEELDEIVAGRQKLTRTHVAITFDDGYLDNYTRAVPVLRSHGVAATFFLVSDYVGSSAVPWWDEIAFLLRETPRPELTLPGLDPMAVPSGPAREDLIRRVLRHYKDSSEGQGAALIAALREQAGCSLPSARRRFLDWDEARAMALSGMSIGSHTRSHRILGRLSPEEQERELRESRREIERRIGFPVSSLAYPVGTQGTFDELTERLARKAGYTSCFSFYGGRNLPGALKMQNILRRGFSSEYLLFRTETLFQAVLGRSPY